MVRNLQFITFTTCVAFGSFGFSGAKCIRMVHIVSFVSCWSSSVFIVPIVSTPGVVFLSVICLRNNLSHDKGSSIIELFFPKITH